MLESHLCAFYSPMIISDSNIHIETDAGESSKLTFQEARDS